MESPACLEILKYWSEWKRKRLNRRLTATLEQIHLRDYMDCSRNPVFLLQNEAAARTTDPGDESLLCFYFSC